jgi:hypothetical protein
VNVVVDPSGELNQLAAAGCIDGGLDLREAAVATGRGITTGGDAERLSGGCGGVMRGRCVGAGDAASRIGVVKQGQYPQRRYQSEYE